MNVVLFDEEKIWTNLLPLTLTRPVSEIRSGILTIREKWNRLLGTECSYHTQHYLAQKFGLKPSQDFLLINSRYAPDSALVQAIRSLRPEQALYSNEHLIAFNGKVEDLERIHELEKVSYTQGLSDICNVWDIFQKNGQAIEADFALLTSGRKSLPLSSTVTVVGDPSLIFLEEGAVAEACTINTKGGPVYLGKNAEIMEGSAVRGPFALCGHSALKMGTKIYGPTTIGPHCKVGGEVNNSVIFGYTNKAHDGFLGNSVIGEWCNLGADTNNSNLKNNYGNVKLYNYTENKQVDTGLQFCGLIMGDHSKCGINTMFNTGTVVGVGCNIFGSDFPDTHIPDFSWGGGDTFVSYRVEKFLETAERVYQRRNMHLTQEDQNILRFIYERTL